MTQNTYKRSLHLLIQNNMAFDSIDTIDNIDRWHNVTQRQHLCVYKWKQVIILQNELKQQHTSYQSLHWLQWLVTAQAGRCGCKRNDMGIDTVNTSACLKLFVSWTLHFLFSKKLLIRDLYRNEGFFLPMHFLPFATSYSMKCVTNGGMSQRRVFVCSWQEQHKHSRP